MQPRYSMTDCEGLVVRYSGTLERHGFARNRIWTLVAEHPSLNHDDNGNRVSVDLIILKPSEHNLKVLATLVCISALIYVCIPMTMPTFCYS